MARAGELVVKVSVGIVRVIPDALQVVAIVGGWGLMTWGVAELLVWEVWPISGGLFLLSVSGWGFLRKFFSTGLFALSRKPKRG